MMEEWRFVKGYEGIYEVSSFGNVRSIDRLCNGRYGNYRFAKGRTLSPGHTVFGYPQVNLSQNGIAKMHLVHRLVAFAYLPAQKEGDEVCHFDGNPLNCHADNLRYDTRKNNHADKIRHKTMLQGESVNNSRITGDDVLKIRESVDSAYSLSKIFGISEGHICAIRKGKAWKHIGGKIITRDCRAGRKVERKQND